MKHIDSNKQIKLGALFSYIAIGFNIVSGLLYTPWMVRSLGQSDYGLYTLASSLISMFLLDFGISSAVTRFVSKYKAEEDQESVNNFLGLIYKLYFIIDIVIFIVLSVVYFYLDSIYSQLTLQEIARFKIVYVIAGVFNLATFPFVTLNGILTSYEEFVSMKLVDLSNKLLVVITTILSLVFGGGLYALVIINAFWNIISILVKIIIIKKVTPININFKYINKKMFKEIFGFSSWTTIASISQRMIFNITPSILGALSGSASIAVFGVASAIEGYVYTFAAAINGMFLPKVTRILAKNNKYKAILSLMIKVGRIQLLIIGLITVGFLSIGLNFVNLWMGPEYSVAYYCAIALIVPSVFHLPQEIANTTLIATGKVKYQGYVFICMALLNVGLSLIFTQHLGVFGASLSIFVAYMVRTIGMNIIYYKELNINIFIFFKECHIKMLPALILSLIVGILVEKLVLIYGWIGILIKVCMISLAYSIIMWKFAMNTYEKELIIATAKGIINKMRIR